MNKSLTDIQIDMSALYDQLRDGALELKLASELANIAGKNLKAKQLELAESIFMQSLPSKQSAPRLENMKEKLFNNVSQANVKKY